MSNGNALRECPDLYENVKYINFETFQLGYGSMYPQHILIEVALYPYQCMDEVSLLNSDADDVIRLSFGHCQCYPWLSRSTISMISFASLSYPLHLVYCYNNYFTRTVCLHSSVACIHMTTSIYHISNKPLPGKDCSCIYKVTQPRKSVIKDICTLHWRSSRDSTWTACCKASWQLLFATVLESKHLFQKDLGLLQAWGYLFTKVNQCYSV